MVQVAFHPGKPFLFVATQNHVRIYNLAKQALAKKLLAGSGLSCMAVHPSGDHVIIGSEVRHSPATPVGATPFAMQQWRVFTLHVRCLCERLGAMARLGSVRRQHIAYLSEHVLCTCRLCHDQACVCKTRMGEPSHI